jgi:hypothetical protein
MSHTITGSTTQVLLSLLVLRRWRLRTLFEGCHTISLFVCQGIEVVYHKLILLTCCDTAEAYDWCIVPDSGWVVSGHAVSPMHEQFPSASMTKYDSPCIRFFSFFPVSNHLSVLQGRWNTLCLRSCPGCLLPSGKVQCSMDPSFG